MTRLAALALLLCSGIASPYAQEPTRAPVGPVSPTREALVDALVSVGNERDQLRTALSAAQAEIARQRASYDALRATLTESEAALTQALDLNVALMESHKVMSGLLTQERKAASRARWTEVFRVGLPWMAGGYIAAELTDD